MTSDATVIPLCVVGCPARAQLYAVALRRLSARCDGGTVELRVTVVCDRDTGARDAFVSALCAPPSASDLSHPESAAATDGAVAEHDDFEDVLVLEEFGDFLCSAVFVLLEDVERRVAVASQALRAGKHALLEPWSPAPTTALRWGGVDDQFRSLWECLRAADDRAICDFAHTVGAVAQKFDAWLRTAGAGKVEALSALLLQPGRPDVVASKALGTSALRHTAWVRILGAWFDQQFSEGDGPEHDPLDAGSLAVQLAARPGHGPGSLLLSCDASEGSVPYGAMVAWPDHSCISSSTMVTAQGLHYRLSLNHKAATSTLVFNSDPCGEFFQAKGTLTLDYEEVSESVAPPHHFCYKEAEAAADELARFATLVVGAQEGRIKGGAAHSVVTDANDRAVYAKVLRGLGWPHEEVDANASG